MLTSSLCMERGIKDKSILDQFCLAFCRIIEKHTPYIIVSGYLAIASGRVRGTEDIDMIIPRLSKNVFFALHEELSKNDFVCIQSDNPETIYEYLTDNISVRYTYRNAPVPEMEIKFAKDIEVG